MKRKILWIILGVVTGLVLVFLAGPRARVNTQVKNYDNLPEDLDQYLAESEAVYKDIVPDTEKKIIWANADKTKTPYAIIYLHGFSATRQETAPLSDDLAAELGANLYYTRLAGHGRTGDALGDATAQDWLNDTQEALAIGKRLGEKVIVIGTSNGGTLATWLAMQPDTDEVSAYILLSPNYGPKDPMSEVLTWPWAAQLLPIVMGPQRSWEPVNAGEAFYWTESYPSKVLLQMMALVKYVRESDLESIQKPVLVVYSPNDQVVDVEKIKDAYARFAAEDKQIVALEEKVSVDDHVLAGDILAPENTQNMQQLILDFLENH